jgi:hypothetical protein
VQIERTHAGYTALTHPRARNGNWRPSSQWMLRACQSFSKFLLPRYSYCRSTVDHYSVCACLSCRPASVQLRWPIWCRFVVKCRQKGCGSAVAVRLVDLTRGPGTAAEYARSGTQSLHSQMPAHQASDRANLPSHNHVCFFAVRGGRGRCRDHVYTGVVSHPYLLVSRRAPVYILLLRKRRMRHVHLRARGPPEAITKGPINVTFLLIQSSLGRQPRSLVA